MEPLWHGEFGNHFNANIEEEETILTSYGSYGQYEGRLSREGFKGLFQPSSLKE